jgi:hypothetical protein
MMKWEHTVHSLSAEEAKHVRSQRSKMVMKAETPSVANLNLSLLMSIPVDFPTGPHPPTRDVRNNTEEGLQRLFRG